jgi:hypothetical protein
VLKWHGFDYHGVRRDDEVEGFLRTIKRYKKEDSPAAKHYRSLCSVNESAEPDDYAVFSYLIARLYEHGFVERI